jgi:hypothetical protein
MRTDDFRPFTHACKPPAFAARASCHIVRVKTRAIIADRQQEVALPDGYHYRYCGAWCVFVDILECFLHNAVEHNFHFSCQAGECFGFEGYPHSICFAIPLDIFVQGSGQPDIGQWSGAQVCYEAAHFVQPFAACRTEAIEGQAEMIDTLFLQQCTALFRQHKSVGKHLRRAIVNFAGQSDTLFLATQYNL